MKKITCRFLTVFFLSLSCLNAQDDDLSGLPPADSGSIRKNTGWNSSLNVPEDLDFEHGDYPFYHVEGRFSKIRSSISSALKNLDMSCRIESPASNAKPPDDDFDQLFTVFISDVDDKESKPSPFLLLKGKKLAREGLFEMIFYPHANISADEFLEEFKAIMDPSLSEKSAGTVANNGVQAIDFNSSGFINIVVRATKENILRSVKTGLSKYITNMDSCFLQTDFSDTENKIPPRNASDFVEILRIKPSEESESFYVSVWGKQSSDLDAEANYVVVLPPNDKVDRETFIRHLRGRIEANGNSLGTPPSSLSSSFNFDGLGYPTRIINADRSILLFALNNVLYKLKLEGRISSVYGNDDFSINRTPSDIRSRRTEIIRVGISSLSTGFGANSHQSSSENFTPFLVIKVNDPSNPNVFEVTINPGAGVSVQAFVQSWEKEIYKREQESRKAKRR